MRKVKNSLYNKIKKWIVTFLTCVDYSYCILLYGPHYFDLNQGTFTELQKLIKETFKTIKKKTIYICKAHLKVSVHLFKWNIYIYPNLWFESPEKKQIQLLQKSLNNKDPDFYVQQFQKIWNLS